MRARNSSPSSTARSEASVPPRERATSRRISGSRSSNARAGPSSARPSTAGRPPLRSSTKRSTSVRTMRLSGRARREGMPTSGDGSTVKPPEPVGAAISTGSPGRRRRSASTTGPGDAVSPGAPPVPVLVLVASWIAPEGSSAFASGAGNEPSRRARRSESAPRLPSPLRSGDRSVARGDRSALPIAG